MVLSQRIEALLPTLAVVAGCSLDEILSEMIDMATECDLTEEQTEAMIKVMIGSDATN